MSAEQQTYAEESIKTIKAREKLKKQLEEFTTRVTKQALQDKRLEMQRWIDSYAAERVIIKSKFSLFDENRHSAKSSQYITSLLKKIQWHESK